MSAKKFGSSSAFSCSSARSVTHLCIVLWELELEELAQMRILWLLPLL